MLSFFRRIVRSRLGLVITLLFVGLIALAFAAGDISNLGHSIGGSSAGAVITADDRSVSEVDLKNRVQNELQSYRQQQPGLDIATFVAGGGFDAVLDRAANQVALDVFARQQGVLVGKRAIDGRIASIPAFQGADGKFNEALFRRILSSQRISEAQLRADLASEIVQRHLTAPTIGASQVPDQLALPYASLLLERRRGQIGFIPTTAIPVGAAPTDAELATFYQNCIASVPQTARPHAPNGPGCSPGVRQRYAVPERRVARYALVTADLVKDSAAPSEAEIAAAYAQARATRFAARAERDLRQVIVADQKAATALAAKVKGGTAIDAAARAIGLEAATINATDKAGYARQTSAATADAVFAAPASAVVGPLRVPLGWAVVQVAATRQLPGKSLDQARAELTRELTATKTRAALSQLHDTLDDGIGKGSTFAELIADARLKAGATPPLAGDGRNPDDPAFNPPPPVAAIMAAAFGAEPDDDPQLVNLDEEGNFAVVALERVIPAAPRPLAQIRDVVARDLTLERSQAAARKIARDVVAKVGRGTPIAQVFAGTGLKLPPVRPLDASRAELAAQERRAPPPLALMFSMMAKRAKLLEAPDNAGWYVVYLDTIVPGNAAGNAQVLAATRSALGRVVGREYVEQFAAAVRRHVGVKRNDAAIARVRADLAGGGAQ